jgi:hypothetical protein
VSDNDVAEIQAEVQEGIVEAMGEWLEGKRPWSLWGTLTIDSRRRQGQRIETLSKEPVVRGYDKRGFPRVFWGSRVVYEKVLDAPRVAPRDTVAWMIETAMQAASRRLGRRVDWAACLEEFKDGNLHAHLLAYSGQLGEGRNDISAIHKPWFSLAGYCKLEAPRDNLAVSVYIAKYLCKAKGELLFSRKLHLPAEPEVSRLSGTG